MAHWFKSLFASWLKIKNQTIYADNVQQADNINNVINIIFRIHRKKLIPIALLLLMAVVIWKNNFILNGAVSITIDNKPIDTIKIHGTTKIEPGKREVLSTWIPKYSDLKVDQSDEIAKPDRVFNKGHLDQAEKLINPSLPSIVKKTTEEKLASYNPNYGNQILYLLLLPDDLNEAINAYEKLTLQKIDFNKLGLTYYTRGDLDKAIEYYQKSLTIDEIIDNKLSIAKDCSNLGLVYKTRGDLNKAIEYYQRALAIDENFGNKLDLAEDYSNLGLVYKTRGDLDKAIEYHQKSLTIHKNIGNKQGIATNYNNLGLVYKTGKDLDKAIEYYQKALTLNESLNRTEGIALNYDNLGIVYEQKGNKAEAKRYWQKSLELYKYLKSPNEKLVQSWLDAL